MEELVAAKWGTWSVGPGLQGGGEMASNGSPSAENQTFVTNPPESSVRPTRLHLASISTPPERIPHPPPQSRRSRGQPCPLASSLGNGEAPCTRPQPGRVGEEANRWSLWWRLRCWSFWGHTWGHTCGRSDFLRFLCKITESRDVTSKITIVHKLPILSIRAWSGKMLDDRAQGPPMSPKPPLKC